MILKTTIIPGVSKNLLRFGPPALFAIAFLSLIYFQLTGLKLYFSHEAAYPLLYAKTNLETWLPYSSRFSGREISPLSWPLIGSLWILVFGKVSLNAHCATAISFTLFFTAVGYLFARAAQFTRIGTYFFLTLIVLNFSTPPAKYLWNDQVWIWPMNSYGVYDAFSLLTLTVFFFCLRKFAFADLPSERTTIFRRSAFPLLIPSAVWFFLIGLNGTRGFMVIAAPVIAGVVFELILAWRESGSLSGLKRTPEIWLVTLLSLSTAIGVAITTALTKGIPQPWQDGHKLFTLAGPDALPERLLKLLSNWLTIFDALPQAGNAVVSLHGVTKISLTIFSLLILVLPFVRIAAPWTRERLFERITIYRYFFVLLLLAVSCLYGTGTMAPRYLIPLAYAGIFALACTVDSWIKERQFGKGLVVTLLLAPIYLHSISTLTSVDGNAFKESKMRHLAKFLKSKRLQYGYAGPWHSDVLTVWHYSNSAVKIALIDPETFGPHPHGDKQWFVPGEHTGTTFLALPRNDYDTLPKAQALARYRERSFQYMDWVIDVFPKNIAIYLDKPIDPALCSRTPGADETESKLDMGIAGEGHQLSCAGWGATKRIGEGERSIFVRPLHGDASAYLRSSGTAEKLVMHFAAFKEASALAARPFDHISVVVNGQESTPVTPKDLQTDLTLRLKLQNPIPVGSVVEVSFRVNGKGDADTKDFALLREIALE